MKGRGRQPAESLGKRFGGDGARLGKPTPLELFGKERRAGNGCRASAAKKSCFPDTAVDDRSEQLEDIAANGIADFCDGTSSGKFAGVARIAEVIENGFAEHLREYDKGDARIAMR